jgi:hypothetical protein
MADIDFESHERKAIRSLMCWTNHELPVQVMDSHLAHQYHGLGERNR